MIPCAIIFQINLPFPNSKNTLNTGEKKHENPLFPLLPDAAPCCDQDSEKGCGTGLCRKPEGCEGFGRTDKQTLKADPVGQGEVTKAH